MLRAEAARLGSEQFQEAIDAVLDLAEGAEYPPRVLAVGARQPAYAANELLEHAGITDPPVPVDELVQMCGLLLHRVELPDALSGLVIESDDGATIAVNRHHPPTRQRFTIAHELGHHLLDHTDRFHLDLSDGSPIGYDYGLERTANEFAADLLMPRRLVTAALASTPDTARLAAAFEVSEIAMGYRIVNLGLR